LLDENMPHNLRRTFLSHEVVTVAYMGWSGLKNGALLRAAEDSGIEVLVPATKRRLINRTWLGGRLRWLPCLRRIGRLRSIVWRRLPLQSIELSHSHFNLWIAEFLDCFKGR
jgi:hypothetical protein